MTTDETPAPPADEPTPNEPEVHSDDELGDDPNEVPAPSAD